jgi:tRNA nucleotidyltransferase (CCA-adding enzyme)
LLYRVAKADSLGRNAPWVPQDKWYGSEAQEWFLQRARELDVERRPPEPLLLGRHLLELGIEPGPRVGDITRAVYEMQLDGRVRTVAEAISAARQIIESGG